MLYKAVSPRTLHKRLQEALTPNIDKDLLARFDEEIWNKPPHPSQSGHIVNPTPLVDITGTLSECARSSTDSTSQRRRPVFSPSSTPRYLAALSRSARQWRSSGTLSAPESSGPVRRSSKPPRAISDSP